MVIVHYVIATGLAICITLGLLVIGIVLRSGDWDNR